MLVDTLKKFGHPATLLREYHNWAILLRQNQVTLGSLVLICKSQATALSSISPEAWKELPEVIENIEKTIGKLFGYDKINYLMLMMVDPEVHFHVIPRYSASRNFEGVEFFDHSWPKAPDLSKYTTLDEKSMSSLTKYIKNEFSKT